MKTETLCREENEDGNVEDDIEMSETPFRESQRARVDWVVDMYEIDFTRLILTLGSICLPLKSTC